MKKILRLILLVLLFWFAGHILFLLVYGFRDVQKTCDYAVVLGNAVNEDGTLSARLEARVMHSFRLYQEKKVNKIFVSGGLGKEGHLEGSAMAHFLIQKGIPEDDVLVDDKGNTTHLTAVNFKQQYETDVSILVVSQYPHLLRCHLAFHQLGFTDIEASAPSFYEWRDVISLCREFVAYYKYLLVY